MVVSVFIATSLDGYIARTDGSLDWLDAANATVPAGEDCGYHAFMASVDVLVMGRKSYEKVLSLGPWLYGSKPVIVLSSRAIDIPQAMAGVVSHSSESPAQLCARLSREGVNRIYVDGGITIQRFLAAGLVHDLTITMIPVLLGSGIPLFGPLEHDIPLRHVATQSYDFGFVQVIYQTEAYLAIS